MFSVVKFALFFTLVASVYSLGIPARSVHKRHALAVRAPVEVPEPEAMRPWSVPRKRATRHRCASKTSSPSLAGTATGAAATTSSSPTATDSPTPSSDSPPVADAGARPQGSPSPASPAASPAESPAAAPPASPTESTPAPAPSSQPTPATPSPSSSGGSAGMSGSGQITFYDAGLGACGRTNSATDFIAAVAIPMFDNFPGATGNPNNNPICGKQVALTHAGKTITVAIVDRCDACKYGDFDLSDSAFNALADPAVGRTDMTYTFLN